MSAQKRKARTPKAPKTTEPRPDGQSVKLGSAVKKIEFIRRLLGRSIAAFSAAAGAEEIHDALKAADEMVASALTGGRALPPGFRFGGAGGLVIGGTADIKARHADTYAGMLPRVTGLKIVALTEKAATVEADGKEAVILRAHLARPAA